MEPIRSASSRGSQLTFAPAPAWDSFRAWANQVCVMDAPRHHNEMEFNLILGGSYVLAHGGRRRVIEGGHLTLMWGAVPHQDVEIIRPAQFVLINLPLPWFLRCRIPAEFTARLFNGELIASASPDLHSDEWFFRRWHADLQSGDAERRDIVRGEIESRLRRIVVSQLADASDILPAGRRDVAVEMAGFIARHFQEPISVADVAAKIGISPAHAARLFRRVWRISPTAFVTRYRLAEAQRLLATTDRKIVDVALQAGFGSVSQFYSEFQKAFGYSPRQCRILMNGPGTH